jgi:hypothetical protein
VYPGKRTTVSVLGCPGEERKRNPEKKRGIESTPFRFLCLGRFF